MSTLNKGKKYRFNVVDVLLLLVIVISVAGILFLYFFDGNVGKDEKKVETVDIIYTVSQTDVPAILRGKIEIGNSVTEVGGIALGQVIDVEYTDSVYKVFDSENNTTFDDLYPGKIDVKVRISANAVIDDKGVYRVGGFALTPGKEVELRFPKYTGVTVCVSVSEVSK